MSAIPAAGPNFDTCSDIFIEPFKQGAYNIRDALSGKRIEAIILRSGQAATQETTLSLNERATAFVIGALLLVPIVNAVAMLILKVLQSEYLYPPVRQPIVMGPVPNPVTNPTSTSRTRPMPPPAPLPVDGPIIPDPVPTPDQMVARKTAALARLGQIEAMGNADAITRHFDLNPEMLQFNLDGVLQRYPADRDPSDLCNLCDWANIDAAKRAPFRQAVGQFDRNGGDEQHQMGKNLLSRLNSYFNQRRAAVAMNPQAEDALKNQFKVIVDGMNDANRNCIDQVLSQLQVMMLNIVADGFTATRGGREQGRMLFRAGFELCKYRTNLLRMIVVRQNPGEHHMADLERMVMQRLAEVLGLQGSIFNAGARYAGVVRDAEDRIQNAINAFLDENNPREPNAYRPLQFLANGLRVPNADRDDPNSLNNLRNELSDWALRHYGIAAEDTDNPVAATDMNARLSANFDPDAFTDFENGGEWTPASTFLVLEAAGFVRAR